MEESAAATAVGTGTSVGATANGFRDGWLGAVYPLANAIGLITVAFCFSHVRKFKFRTLCEELQFYYDGSPYMRKFMSVLFSSSPLSGSAAPSTAVQTIWHTSSVWI